MANYWKLFKQAKAFYFSLDKIRCSALGGKEIIFDQRGFRHFLLKKRGKRPIPDQIRRFRLLSKIKASLEKVVVFGKEEKEGACLWSLVHATETGSVTIVVLENSGNYYFISIMDRT